MIPKEPQIRCNKCHKLIDRCDAWWKEQIRPDGKHVWKAYCRPPARCYYMKRGKHGITYGGYDSGKTKTTTYALINRGNE